MKYKFIDIGCGHQSVSSDIFGTNVVGMYVEPIKEYLDILPAGKNIVKENSVISDENKIIKFNAVIAKNPQYFTRKAMERIVKNDKSYKRYKEQYSASGQSSLFKFDTIKPFAKQIEVNSLTLESLFQKHNVTEIDYLKIDVEGAEEILLNQLIILLDSNKIKINEQIKFEYNELSDKPQLDKLTNYITQHHNFASKFELSYPWNADIVLNKTK